MVTDAEINQLIAEVESEFKALAKSETASKVEPQKEEKPSEEAQSQDLNKADPSMCKDESEEEQSMEPSLPPEQADEQSPDEGGEEPAPEGMEGEEQGINLDQIYSEMDEHELEEHYEAILRAMHSRWSDEYQSQGAEMGQEPSAEEESMPEETDEAPAMKAEMGEKKVDLAGKAQGELPNMKKTEDETRAEAEALKKAEEIKKLEEENTKLNDALASLVKAMESKLPARKDVTEVIAKSEASMENLEKSEEQIYQEAGELVKTNKLNKSERAIFNKYFVDRTQFKPVVEILKQKKA